jgi:hypothetical protein
LGILKLIKHPQVETPVAGHGLHERFSRAGDLAIDNRNLRDAQGVNAREILRDNLHDLEGAEKADHGPDIDEKARCVILLHPPDQVVQCPGYVRLGPLSGNDHVKVATMVMRGESEFLHPAPFTVGLSIVGPLLWPLLSIGMTIVKANAHGIRRCVRVPHFVRGGAFPNASGSLQARIRAWLGDPKFLGSVTEKRRLLLRFARSLIVAMIEVCEGISTNDVSEY